MYYALNFAPEEEGGYTVTCRNIPELITCGDTDEECIEMAEDVLISCVEVYFEKGWLFPESNEKLRDTERLIYLPDIIFAKVLLHNALIKEKVSKAELAKRMSVLPQSLTPVFTVRHNTKLETISKALEALGYTLHLFTTKY